MSRIVITAPAKEPGTLVFSLTPSMGLSALHTHDIDKALLRMEATRKPRPNKRTIEVARKILAIEGIKWLSIGEHTASVALVNHVDVAEVKEQLKRTLEHFFTNVEVTIAKSTRELVHS